MTTRNQARSKLMQMLFQMDIQGDFSKEAQARYIENFKLTGEQLGYMNEVYTYVAEHLDELDAIIEDASNGWKVARMAKVNLAICRLALAEIRCMDDVPVAVAVNEAVNLAKEFGDEKSPRFVNGLLGKAVKSL